MSFVPPIRRRRVAVRALCPLLIAAVLGACAGARAWPARPSGGAGLVPGGSAGGRAAATSAPEWVADPAADWRPRHEPLRVFVRGAAPFDHSVTDAEQQARAAALGELALFLDEALDELFDVAVEVLPDRQRAAAAVRLREDAGLRSQLVTAALAAARPLGSWFGDGAFHVWMSLDGGELLSRVERLPVERWGAAVPEDKLRDALRGIVARRNRP